MNVDLETRQDEWKGGASGGFNLRGNDRPHDPLVPTLPIQSLERNDRATYVIILGTWLQRSNAMRTRCSTVLEKI